MNELRTCIERWENVERVLIAMPEHERQQHWDMSIWGKQTACGTIACAAGHCGLDPWFRDRGFRLDFHGTSGEISDVAGFFGVEGSSKIFFDSTPRPVETVISEVQSHLGRARRMSELTEAAPCRIGEVWAGQGGVYAGARIGRDGAPDYHLIVGPDYHDYITWFAAIDWAASLDIEGHRDFTLPDRDEQLALFDRVRSLFKREWYWSREQHELYSTHAWTQDFDYGYQGTWHKDLSYRARSVRRLIIQ